MAYETISLPGNSRIVRKFDNVAVDFPPLGVITSAGTQGIAIVVDTVTDSNLTVQVTFDSPVTGGVLGFTADTTWYPVSAYTVSTGDTAYLIFSIAPTGVLLGGSTAGAAILT